MLDTYIEAQTIKLQCDPDSDHTYNSIFAADVFELLQYVNILLNVLDHTVVSFFCNVYQNCVRILTTTSLLV